jgi:hypothetical protein
MVQGPQRKEVFIFFSILLSTLVTEQTKKPISSIAVLISIDTIL